MPTQTAYEDSRLSIWLRVREFAVPAPMIETATARRRVGDWAGACAAAGVDVDLHLRSVAHQHGQELAARVRADLRLLAPDLLRWHMPRIAPNGLLRPGLTMALARYDVAARNGPHPVHLVARTPPAWASAGQRISLALWDGSHGDPAIRRHPHPYPSRRFRLDLHRHLWDATSSDELRIRSGAEPSPTGGHPMVEPDLLTGVPQRRRCAMDRWAAEAGMVLHAEGRTEGPVLVRLAAGHRLVLHLTRTGDSTQAPRGSTDARVRPLCRITAVSAEDTSCAAPLLPDAATWVLPDLELIRSGLIEVGRLHPLVASALAPDHATAGSPRNPEPTRSHRLVRCRGVQHRIGLVNGVLTALDHDPAEIRREELLAALTGTPLPCVRAIDEAHRSSPGLDEVRDRLNHGDTAGALSAVEALLGPAARLPQGALRDALDDALSRRIAYGLFRAGLAEPRPGRPSKDPGRTRKRRSRPRA